MGLLLSCYEDGECIYDRSTDRMENLSQKGTRCTAADFPAGSFLAESGKRWVVAHINNTADNVTLRTYEATGWKTGCYTFLQVSDGETGGDTPAVSVRDWDGKAFVEGDAPKGSPLLYDFKAVAGDSIPLYGRDGTDEVMPLDSVYVIETGTMESCGRTYQTMTVERRKQHLFNKDTGQYARTTLVRGIGNADTPFENVFRLPQDTSTGRDIVIRCYVNDELIYENIPDEIRGFVGITLPPAPTTTPRTVSYDLQGRRIGSVPHRGIYLQGGRKVMAK
ncbi:MAG: hypothetical protein IJ729_02060 [Alloprevotella sp.]|nr:hypothetical protein [Alloprevotella sp.]